MIAERREQLFHRLVEWLPAVLWAAVIFRLSATPGRDVPPWIDPQLGHFLMYALLGACLVIPFQRLRRPWVVLLIAVVIASAYGISDEWHQSFVPGRTPDVWDWAIDTAGATAGALLAMWVVRRRARAAAAARAAAKAAAAATQDAAGMATPTGSDAPPDDDAALEPGGGHTGAGPAR